MTIILHVSTHPGVENPQWSVGATKILPKSFKKRLESSHPRFFCIDAHLNRYLKRSTILLHHLSSCSLKAHCHPARPPYEYHEVFELLLLCKCVPHRDRGSAFHSLSPAFFPSNEPLSPSSRDPFKFLFSSRSTRHLWAAWKKNEPTFESSRFHFSFHLAFALTFPQAHLTQLILGSLHLLRFS